MRTVSGIQLSAEMEALENNNSDVVDYARMIRVSITGKGISPTKHWRMDM